MCVFVCGYGCGWMGVPVKLYFVRFFPNHVNNYVCNLMYAFVPVLGLFVFLGRTFFWAVQYCPVFVFLAYGETWRCGRTLFCVEIVKHHIVILIDSFIHS